MKSTKVLAIAFLIFALTSCATNNINKNFQFDPSNGKGVMLGSVTYSGMLSKYIIEYKNLDTNKSGWVSTGKNTIFETRNPITSLEKMGFKGDIFALELDPGKYIFNGWRVSSSITISSNEIFKVEVVVEAGKPIYIGNFHFVQTKSFGLVVTGVDVFYSSKFERDSKQFAMAYPLITEMIIPKNIDKTVQIGSKKEGYFSVLLKAIEAALPVYTP